MCLTIYGMKFNVTNVPGYTKLAVPCISTPHPLEKSGINPEQKKVGSLLCKSLFSVVFFCNTKMWTAVIIYHFCHDI